MRVPDRLAPLIEQGVIDAVLRPLQSGKEAQVYLVDVQGWTCVAKVYKEAEQRSFKHRAEYGEGRKVRNTRDARAMAKRTKYGREQVEEAWRNAEVEAIYKLREAGVRVPEPYAFVDGVLVMELVANEAGEPAPRLIDLDFDEDLALRVFNHLLAEIIRMLLAGVIHGDLSDFNVLMAPDGPVIIDFPQWSDPAISQAARKLLVRDVDNVTSFLARHAPALEGLRFGEEMWALYESGDLRQDTLLTGKWTGPKRSANVSDLLREIEEVEWEARKKREALGLPPPRGARAPIQTSGPPPAPKGPRTQKPKKGGNAPGGNGGQQPRGGQQQPQGGKAWGAPPPQGRGGPPPAHDRGNHGASKGRPHEARGRQDEPRPGSGARSGQDRLMNDDLDDILLIDDS